MKHFVIFFFLVSGLLLHAQTNHEIKTTFQTAHEWRPTIDIRADAAMIYGIGGNPSDSSHTISFEDRVNSWADKGYITHFMTGIAWGEYQDYFNGSWDGKLHFDEGQMQQNGDTIWHGPMVPYIVPTDNYLNYIKLNHVKRAIDAGISTIFLEEPEFWAFGGYSEAFKREWKKYYGEDWKPQDASPNNTYLSNKLKYHLFYHALQEVFSYAKEYGKSKGMDVKCFVPTHSLINYTQWRIVSPEASLASMSCVDGYIAQVWTGTSRTPIYYKGEKKERVFETAFLEYGSMESMTAPTGRKMYFLTDPIEDGIRDWADYLKNYQATYTAQLLYPHMANYEVMPWPSRIYEKNYKTSATSDKEEKIPRSYSTQMQVMIHALGDMPVSDNEVSGSQGIGVLMANSMMFQRFPTFKNYEDPQLSSFFGQTLPLLKRGVPVKTVHIENVSYPDTWKNLHVLVMSYSNMKPMEQSAHAYIAEWVKNGGVLIYCGSDKDVYQNVPEWWNSDGKNFEAPSEDLFLQLGLQLPVKEGEYKYGKGTVCVLRTDPKEFVLNKDADMKYIQTVQKMYKSRTNGDLEFKNSFALQRGPYEIISVLDENKDKEPYVAKGILIDLFDPAIPVMKKKEINPGEQAFVYHVERIQEKNVPKVIVSAARVYEEKNSTNSYTFVVKSPAFTTNVMRVLLPKKAKRVKISDKDGKELGFSSSWDKTSKTCFLSFENDPDGVNVELEW